MYLELFLIFFPAIAGTIILLVNHAIVRKWTVLCATVLLFIGALSLLATTYHRDVYYFHWESFLFDKAMFVFKLLIAAGIVYAGVKARRYRICLLMLLQYGLMMGFEIGWGHAIQISHSLFIDRFSLIIALITGIVGGLITLYALGYMKEFHEAHPEIKDRRNIFFFLVFIFLSAMFGIVFSNNLLWIYFFWEITTVCSFLLIAYKRTEESLRNAFHALELNLWGGLSFAIGIVYLGVSCHTLELHQILTLGKAGVLFPVVLISIAGLVKAAQLPFSSWLLGAMVAPTPVSALLHSSTMVKAGVYMVLRFASVLQNTWVGGIFAVIGGITFVVGSFVAISQSDAKKVLAYSTIANLGLIVVCAGVGTYEAVWAGILLIIFHALAKCLLFLCVGVVEGRLGSRDIEDMAGLIVSMPKLSIMLQIGMAGMFLAPFGMLISKWAVLKALVDYNPLLAVFVIFGSAATLFFWVKWMGRLITVVGLHEEREDEVTKSEWSGLITLSVLTIGVCACFPWIANILIEPYIKEMYGTIVMMNKGNVLIMLIMLGMVMLFPFSFFHYGKRVKVVDAYLGGANTPDGTSFYDALGNPRDMAMKSVYLQQYFNEEKWLRIGVGICLFLLAVLIFIAGSPFVKVG